VDYSIWGALQQPVYRQKFKNIDHLKQVLISLLGHDQPRTHQHCWSFVRSVDTLNIVSVNQSYDLCLLQTISVMNYIENIVGIDFFEYRSSLTRLCPILVL